MDGSCHSFPHVKYLLMTVSNAILIPSIALSRNRCNFGKGIGKNEPRTIELLLHEPKYDLTAPKRLWQSRICVPSLWKDKKLVTPLNGCAFPRILDQLATPMIDWLIHHKSKTPLKVNNPTQSTILLNRIKSTSIIHTPHQTSSQPFPLIALTRGHHHAKGKTPIETHCQIPTSQDQDDMQSRKPCSGSRVLGLSLEKLPSWR